MWTYRVREVETHKSTQWNENDEDTRGYEVSINEEPILGERWWCCPHEPSFRAKGHEVVIEEND
jgi:hypothetical protein